MGLWLLLACDAPPDRPARADSLVSDTAYVDPPLFDTTTAEPAEMREEARLGVVRAAPPAGGADTVLDPRGYTIVTRWVPQIVGVDTIGRPPPPPEPVLPDGGFLLLGMSGSPTACAPGDYGFTLEGVRPDNVIATLEAVAKCRKQVVLNLMGGSHERYKSPNPDKRTRDQGYRTVFDKAKWLATLKQYDTPAHRAAFAKHAGRILWVSGMDEPANVSIKTGNYWGPPGTLNRASVSDLCREMRQAVPAAIPVGVVQDPRHFDTGGTYTRDCQMTAAQFRLSKGGRACIVANPSTTVLHACVDAWAKGVKTALRTSPHIGVMPSLNMLHGGTPSTTCPKYGDDPSGKLCPVTPQQFTVLATRIARAFDCHCVNTWRWQQGYTNRPDYLSAATAISHRAPSRASRRVR